MKVVVFSDVHSHFYALEKLFEIEYDADLFICLGDVVGYGNSNDCIKLIQSKNNVIYLKGNHEEMFIKDEVDNNCSKLAKDAFTVSYNLFNKKYISYLSNLKNSLEIDNYIFKHTINNTYFYKDTDIPDLDKITFIGHSHIQFRNDNLINVGSLGQNKINKGISKYAIIIDNEIKLKFFVNDLNNFIKDLKKYNFNEELIKYYMK